ncbi:MAG: hypothetical protein GY725_13920 [bacterium]|nr:hypothetical protein [bacterium]
MKSVLITLGALFIAFGATTWWALESGGVAVVETRSPEGVVRSTHVWYTEPDGVLWLEAGTVDNPWFTDVQEHPELVFRAGGLSGRYVAQRVDAPSGHDKIRSLIRQKYGLRDRWVGLLVDTSGSVAVQLVPIVDSRTDE